MSLTIDQVTDNGDNSLTIIAHDGEEIYETSMGRKSELPANPTAQMAYYKQVVVNSLPPDDKILYKNPAYTPPQEEEAN